MDWLYLLFTGLLPYNANALMADISLRSTLVTPAAAPVLIHSGEPTVPSTGTSCSGNYCYAITISSTQSGHVLVLGLVDTNAEFASIMSIADNAGNLYISANANGSYASGDDITQIWYVPVTISGATTVTITSTNASLQLKAWYAEFSNAQIGTSAAASNQTASTTITAPTVTTTTANAAVFSVASAADTISGIKSGNPFTALTINSGDAAYDLPTSTGAYGAVWNQSASGAYCASTVSLVTPSSSYAPLTYVQSNSVQPTSNESTVSVAYTSAQTAHHLNIVVVGWNDATSNLASTNPITDSKGNTYQLAVGPTRNTTDTLSQAIYYATNIASAAAGANTVTVNFANSVPAIDIRILEYTGTASTVFDAASGSYWTGSSGSTGSAVTHYSSELVVAATTTENNVSGVGWLTGTLTQRIYTNPNGDDDEDGYTGPPGTYSVSSITANTGVAQMATFH